MKCVEVQPSLIFFLDGEVSPDERSQIQQHLSGCTACQKELAALTAVRHTTGQTLQSLTAHKQPSPQAWDHLQAKLAQEARPAPAGISTWLSSRAPGLNSRMEPHTFQGDRIMRKQIMLPALAAVIVLTIVAIFMARGATPVSAQQILDRAYQAQQVQNPAQGIRHIRIEKYDNYQALPDAQAGVRTIDESYLDFQSGNVRTVVTDANNGRVLDVFVYDGSYTYSNRTPADVKTNDILKIYRIPQSKDKVALDKPTAPAASSAKDIFETMRQDADVKLVGSQTLPDGRKVYVLSSEHPAKVIVGKDVQLPTGYSTVVFDARTYQIIESKTTIHQNGKEIVINSDQYLTDELLPAGTPVAWDLSDLKGVTIVDDPKGQHGDMLPETLTLPELVAKASSVYYLKNPPAGFEQQISAPPQQDAGQRFDYIISYRNQTGDYFVIQTNIGPTDWVAQATIETYKTTSGLVLNFIEVPKPGAKNPQYSEAVVQTRDGIVFNITSTLPLDQVKKLAEDLIHIVG